MAATSPTTEKPTDKPASAVAESSKEAANPASSSNSADPEVEPKSAAGAKETADSQSEAPIEVPKDPKGIIDLDTFQQIRDMDEDEDEDRDEDADPHEFSRGIVYGFFEQAEKTFEDMKEALAEKNLEKLSSLGHFLKGSSAALGIVKVQNNCEKIQHYGHKTDDDGGHVEADEALEKIRGLLVDCKKDYAVAQAWLYNLYEEES